MTQFDHFPINVQRTRDFNQETAERIHALAKQILAEIGLEVLDAGHREKLSAAGLAFRGKRLVLAPDFVDAQVEEMRSQVSAWGDGSDGGEDRRLTMSVSSYSLYVQEIESGSVEPATTGRLVEMTKLIDTLAGEGVSGAPPGIPTEVHPDLQPLAQYLIGATYARQGASPVDPTAPHTARFLLEMAEVMGNPIRGLPVYIPTPLRLGGESLAVVMACLDRLEHISITSMPATGLSAPVQPFGALALAAAEVIGGMIAVKILTGKPVTCAANIFPGDLREGSMVFGSPENVNYQMLCADFNRFYGWHTSNGPENFHVMAKMPDGQSAAEKSAIMMLGAALGVRHFSCAGTLSLDEIFSAEQLLLDCEIRDWVQRAVSGLRLGEGESVDWLAEIRGGVQTNFMGLDVTLDHYQHHAWYPRRFTRKAIGPWLEDGRPALSSRLRAEARQRIARHDFELDAQRRRELERIFALAKKTVFS